MRRAHKGRYMYNREDNVLTSGAADKQEICGYTKDGIN